MPLLLLLLLPLLLPPMLLLLLLGAPPPRPRKPLLPSGPWGARIVCKANQHSKQNSDRITSHSLSYLSYLSISLTFTHTDTLTHIQHTHTHTMSPCAVFGINKNNSLLRPLLWLTWSLAAAPSVRRGCCCCYLCLSSHHLHWHCPWLNREGVGVSLHMCVVCK